jgi:tRNA(fMet)-specific endonuclease VapC
VVALPKFIIDTDVFSFVFKGDPKALFFRTYLQGADVYITFASIGELYFGAYKDNWGERRIKDIEIQLSYYIVIPSNDAICILYGKIRNECKKQPIDDLDYWIASCARYYDIPLVTNNWKHFKNIEGLKIISPGHIT